jgi:hypothetical protein
VGIDGLDQIGERSHLGFQRGSPELLGFAGGRSGLNGDDAADVTGGDEEVDEVRRFTEKTTAWSACSIGSWCDGEGRLEAVGRLGKWSSRRVAMGKSEGKV